MKEINKRKERKTKNRKKMKTQKYINKKKIE